MSIFEEITSLDNPKVKLAKKVRDGKNKEILFVEGVKLIEELLKAKIEINYFMFSESALQSDEANSILDEMAIRGIKIYETTDKVIRAVSDMVNPPGMLAIAYRKEFQFNESDGLIPEIDSDPLPLWVYLYEINNPSNVGAILRTVNAAGASGVIMSPNSADAYSPKALRASMGAAFRVKIIQNANFEDVKNLSENNGLTIAAADVKAASSYTDLAWNQPRIIIFGSESQGLPGAINSRVDEIFKIPMQNNVESLNIAVSAGVILFEARRQFDGIK